MRPSSAAIGAIFPAAGTRVEQDAHDILAVGRVVAAEYAAGKAPFQDQVHVRSFVFDYLTTHATGMLAWAERARAAVDEWPQTTDEARDRLAVAASASDPRPCRDPANLFHLNHNVTPRG